jgi:hypothetical protein
MLAETQKSLAPPRIIELKSESHYKKHKWGQEFQICQIIPSVRLLHIGKCGGTTIRHAFLSQGIDLGQYHMKKPNPIKTNERLIVWIRNPFERFISSFNHSKAIIDFDVNSGSRITLNNCVSPMRINKKIQTGRAFSPEYERLLNLFQSASELAESLTSQDQTLRHKAFKLVQHPEEHIYKGIGWYLSSGQFISRHSKRILAIGRVEHFASDLIKLGQSIGVDFSGASQTQRFNTAVYPKQLSQKAICNLRKFCLAPDFQALEKMWEEKLISRDTLYDYTSLDQ